MTSEELMMSNTPEGRAYRAHLLDVEAMRRAEEDSKAALAEANQASTHATRVFEKSAAADGALSQEIRDGLLDLIRREGDLAVVLSDDDSVAWEDPSAVRDHVIKTAAIAGSVTAASRRLVQLLTD
jgi:hypothetical protein